MAHPRKPERGSLGGEATSPSPGVVPKPVPDLARRLEGALDGSTAAPQSRGAFSLTGRSADREADKMDSEATAGSEGRPRGEENLLGRRCEEVRAREAVLLLRQIRLNDRELWEKIVGFAARVPFWSQL